MRGFVELYRKYSKIDEMYAHEISCYALCKLHMYLGNYSPTSPLTSGPLKSEAQWDAENDSFEWLSFVLQNINTPFPEKKLREFAGSGDVQLERLLWELSGSVIRRMQNLETLSESIPKDSIVYPEIAFLRSLHQLHQFNDTHLAEKLVHEALKSMDTYNVQR